MTCFRRELRELHEIELSSVCNLACVYCPHPTLRRPKAHMSRLTFTQTRRMLRRLVAQGTQTEVSLTGIGEALLHPHFAEMARQIREDIGPSRQLTVATNGIAVDGAMAALLAEVNATVWVSLHRPEVAGPALKLLLEHGVITGYNHQFATASLDWAGQVDWPVSSARGVVCEYLARGWGVVRSDGSITTCCMDAHGLHSFGHVAHSELSQLELRPHSLCDACTLSIPTTEALEDAA